MNRDARAGVVFDLDGTLIDSRADIAAAVNHALARNGRAPLGEAEIATYVGDGARALVARAAAIAPEDARLEPFLADFLAYYRAHAVVHTRLMAHALEALDALSDLPLAICTNKPRETTERVLDRLLPHAPFRAIVAGGDLPAPKPDPACLHHIGAQLGVGARALVIVGDGVQDVECARAASARSVAVTFGFTPEARLRAARPTRVAHDLLEAAAAVRDLTRRASDTPP